MSLLRKSIFLIVILVFTVLTACNTANLRDNSADSVNSDNFSSVLSVDEVASEQACTHDYEVVVTLEPQPLVDGENIFTCKLCDHSYTEIIPATKTLKVLAVGNSFSVDGMEYLWQLAHDGGVEEIILGNLYIGGCSLDMHWSNIQSDAAKYTYYKNTKGEWTETEKTAISTAIADEDWDFVTLQQVSAKSGLPDSYGNVNNVINHLASELPNAKFFWHQTWAYQHDAYTSNFKAYDRNQLKMYKAIIDTFSEKVAPNKNVDGVIPAGTSIQNVRTTKIGDILTRDGHHLSYDYGRYTASFAWYAALTGGQVDIIKWYPEKYPKIGENLELIKGSVKDAVKNPFEITEQK
jgi:hypothetical protein